MSQLIGSSLRDLPRLRECTRGRLSSWDRTGGNDDFLVIQPGETRVIGELRGPGCISHVWMTTECKEAHYLRKVVLRFFWESEADPSVEAPLGDFFGMGHAQTANFWSLPLSMSPQSGRGFNCFFPMPFGSHARIEVTNQCSGQPLDLYYYIDYEAYDAPIADLGRFHAQWRRTNPCTGVIDSDLSNEAFQFSGTNLTATGNYIILEAEGRGHYVGCNLNIHNLRLTDAWNWYGEGDDMIFIDGEVFPPSLHGTGTEDYFNMAYCPDEQFFSPYHGMILPGGPNWSGKISLYRFHIEDPIMFKKSIRVTVEHGHANRRSDDYSSTAYWYQTEPHLKTAVLPPPDERLPRGG